MPRPWEQLELRGLGAVASLAAKATRVGGQRMKCELEPRSSIGPIRFLTASSERNSTEVV